MRSSTVLLLLLVAAVGAGLGFVLWNSPAQNSGLEGPKPIDGPLATKGSELPGGPLVTAPQAGEREEVESAPTVVAPADNGLTEAELAELDSNALVGLVVDAEGNGIPACEVTFIAGGLQGIHRVFGAQLEIDDAPKQITDQSGAFRFVGVEPGDQHALRVHHREISMRFVEGVTVADFGVSTEPPILLLYGKRIRGLVTNELDLPVVGAELHLDGMWRAADPQASHDRLSTVTDSEGKYEILGVPDGTRCLTAVAPNMGQITRIQSLIFSDATGQAHIANLKLLGAALCTGRVTDAAGNGIAGIDVLAVDRKSYRDVNNNRITSGPDGSFSFPNLARGTYHVVAKGPGYRPVVRAEVKVPQEGLSIVLDDQRLIHGVVVDAKDGKGLASFHLQLLQQGVAGTQAIPRGMPIEVQSPGGGRFTIPLDEKPGLWRMQASAEGYAVSVSEPFTIEFASDVADVVVAMNRGGTIRGVLLDGSGGPVVGGRVTSRDNAWTDDAFSQMLGAEEGHAGTVLDARSGRDGTFTLQNLRAGDYQLIVRSGDLHQQVLRGLSVVEEQTLDAGVITMLPGGGLHGALLDSESARIPGGSIFLNPVGNASGAPVRRCKSGHDGRWEIKNIVPGDYTLSGKPPGQAEANALGFWPSSGGEPVQITGGVDDSRDIHLTDWTIPAPPEPDPPTGQLSGKLTNSSGAALLGRQVRLSPVTNGASPETMGKTAREGAFAFMKLLPGDYDLSIVDQPDSTHRVTIRIDTWTYQDLVAAE